MNTSIEVPNTIEFLDIVPVNPLISHCKIKVCYVGDEPNRNKSIITEEVARQIATSLPGSPIVGYFSKTKEDFEEHDEIITIKNGKIDFTTDTVPYGFVSMDAKVWFEDYNDNGTINKYLVTEGYIWTGQFPEAQAIIDEGRPQSLEFDKNIDAFWSKDSNNQKQFFIINEAIISKLCILGNDVEPCFEGASVTDFSLDKGWKNTMFSLINEMQNMLKGGTNKMEFTKYALEIGDTLYSGLYSFLEKNYPNTTVTWEESIYGLAGVYENTDNSKFAILRDRTTSPSTFKKMNFTYSETQPITQVGELIDVEQKFIDINTDTMFALDDIKNYEETRYAAKKDPKKTPTEDPKPIDNKCGGGNGGGGSKDEDEKKTKYCLDDVIEYQTLLADYTTMKTEFEALKTSNAELTTKYATIEQENKDLLSFKKATEKVEKEEMIKKFYMLSDEDKKDVTDNIDTYSLSDIESKLSIICVKNRVNFTADEDNNNDGIITYGLHEDNSSNETGMPAWLKKVEKKQKTLI